MKRRFLAAIAAAAFVVLVVFGIVVHGQAFYPPNTPKFPQARTWLAQKAKLPPYKAPRTPDGVPDLQGNWGGPVGGGNNDIEEHEYIDVTTPPQESFVSDPPDGKSRTRRGRWPNGTRSAPGWREDGPVRQASGSTAIPRRCAWLACPAGRSARSRSFRDPAP